MLLWCGTTPNGGFYLRIGGGTLGTSFLVIASDDSSEKQSIILKSFDTLGLLRGETARNDGWLLFGGFNRALLL